MSNSIKDIIKTFKSLQEPEEQVVETTTIQAAPVQVAALKPTIEKQQKAVKTEKLMKVEQKAVAPKTIAQPMSGTSLQLSDEFFNALMNQEFTYEDRRIAYLESDLYEIFMSLKRKKKLKNISVLINAILNQVVEDNKEQIKQILVNTRL